MKFDYPNIFLLSCQSLNCTSHNSATVNRQSFILLLLGWSTPRSHRRGQGRDVPGRAGDAAAGTEGPCYVPAHQAEWAALVTSGPALDFQDSNSGACRRVFPMRQQLWGLQNDFHPGMATLGLAGGFLPRTTALGLAGEFPHWTTACWGFPSIMAALGLARGFYLAVDGAIAAPGSAQGSSHSPGCSFTFLLLAYDLNVSMFRF